MNETGNSIFYQEPRYEPKGVWIARYADGSSIVPFADEKSALRYAVDHAMNDVVFVEWGQEARR